MDFIKALVDWFVANWGAIEGLARGLAADLAALWVLALGLAAVLKPFLPRFGAALQEKTLGILGQ
ncbi:MAG: hypothetical protein AAB864_00005 [Patescibacteria group bacterium]